MVNMNSRKKPSYSLIPVVLLWQDTIPRGMLNVLLVVIKAIFLSIAEAREIGSLVASDGNLRMNSYGIKRLPNYPNQRSKTGPVEA